MVSRTSKGWQDSSRELRYSLAVSSESKAIPTRSSSWKTGTPLWIWNGGLTQTTPATARAPEVIEVTGPGDKGISCPPSGGASSSASPLPARILVPGVFFLLPAQSRQRTGEIHTKGESGKHLTDRGAGAHVPCPTSIAGVLSRLFILKQDTPGDCESGESPLVRSWVPTFQVLPAVPQLPS